MPVATRLGEASISVIVPVFNGERFLQDALDSVFTQDVSGLDLVVVDDGSTDGTEAIVRRLGSRVSYIRQTNQGQAAAVNNGLRHARGEVVSILDADDLWVPGAIAGLRREMAQEPGAEIVSGLTSRYKDGRPLGVPFPALFFGSSLIRRSLFERVGLQDERLRFSEDADWFLRALEAGASVRFAAVPTLYYREHDANLTCDKASTLRGYTAVLKRSLDRRRTAAGAVRPLSGGLIHPTTIARRLSPDGGPACS
jgi:glycosyltransferase involved in cell wall biosynthesis